MIQYLRPFVAKHYHRLRHAIDFYRNETPLVQFTPRGHFHSPMPDIINSSRFADVAAKRGVTEPLPGIALNNDHQKRILEQIEDIAAEFDWPAAQSPDRRYFTEQGWFNASDALTLYGMLRILKPERIIEVGSGFSSALMLDAISYKLKHDIAFTFIEPNPGRLNMLLKKSDERQVVIRQDYVQDIPMSLFDELSANDILFVDSSHVSRTGSDVNHIVFEILPRLAVGVVIHFHDVFWPFEYPSRWLRMGLAWNEAYLLRSFLLFNNCFEIMFWPQYAASCSTENSNLAVKLRDAQSIWIRRVR